MCNIGVSGILIYYTHLPVLIASIVMGVFVLLADKKNPINRYLFMFIAFFCFWAIDDLFEWLITDPWTINLLAQISLIGLISLIFLLYFAYSFAKIQLSLKRKIIFALPYIPILAFMFTKYNVVMTGGQECNSEFGLLYWYVYLFILVYILWTIIILIRYHRKKDTDSIGKKQIKIIMAGSVFVVLWFFIFIGVTDVSVNYGFYLSDKIFLFVPFGMLVFIGMLAYAITKYQFLNIKLIAAQILTYAVWILIGSQYFFADSLSAYLLTSITFILSIFFGIMLIKSVKLEVERKEQLQSMSDSLAVANDQLRKLDNAKTEFISIASHQLRTPITAVKGFASLLLEGSYGEISKDVRGALEKIYVSSERLVNLIEDLLNVSRIESGRLTFTFENASVEKILKELYDNFLLISKTKKFYLDLKMPKEPLPEFKMDAAKIRELISNFIDNALKYTEKGGVTISAEMRDAGTVIDEQGFVKVGEKAPYGKVVRITVSDTGIGIPQEEIPYLFRKFSRGKDVSRLHVGGTGLGLYVGKAIADAHHGATWVESDGAGMGSRFIIEIPIEQGI